MIQGKRLDETTRRGIVDAIAKGERIVDVCKRFHVNRSTVQELIRASLATPSTPPPSSPPSASPSASPSGSPPPPSSAPSSDLPGGAADPEALARARAAAGESPASGGAVPPPPPNAPPPNPLDDAKFVVGVIGGLKQTAVEGCISAGFFPDLPGVHAAGNLTPIAEEVLTQNASLVAPALRKIMNVGWVGVAIGLGLDAIFTYLAIRGAVVQEMRRPGGDRKPAPAPSAPPPMPQPGQINPQPTVGQPGPGKTIDAEFVPFDPLRPPKPGDIPDPSKKVA